MKENVKKLMHSPVMRQKTQKGREIISLLHISLVLSGLKWKFSFPMKLDKEILPNLKLQLHQQEILPNLKPQLHQHNFKSKRQLKVQLQQSCLELIFTKKELTETNLSDFSGKVGCAKWKWGRLVFGWIRKVEGTISLCTLPL